MVNRWAVGVLGAVLLVVLVGGVATSGATADAASSHINCTADPTEIETGETVTLDASNTDASYVEFDIDGDGEYERLDETDFLTNVTYEQSGTYDPVVRADGDPNLTDPCGQVSVNDPPTAVIDYSPSTVAVGTEVTFDASQSSDSDGEIVEYRWDFDGDGVIDRTTEGPQTTHTYDEAREYGPGVIVVDDDGSTDFDATEIFVEENERPAAELGVSPNPADVGETVTLDASGSFDSDGEIVEYRWDLTGDGNIDGTTGVNSIENTYEEAGLYMPAVTVVDDDGATSTAERDLVIEQPSSAVCEARPTNVGVDETVTLDASGSNASYVEFDIDGDGEYERGDETDFIINVTYAEEGTYTPVARADGDPDATDPCGEVTVDDNEPPTASFTIDPRPGSVGSPVTFDASASSDPDGDIVAYQWDFDGDGNTDETVSDPVTEHVFDQPGGYGPTLTVVDNEGASDTFGRDLRVEQPTETVCEAEPTVIQPGETVTLDASGSQASYVEFDIDGDGEYERGDETDLIITVTYEEPGTYNPVARGDGDPEATDPCGEITVNEPPVPEFSIDPRPGLVGSPVTFDASASIDPDGTIVEYQWDFDGDGNTDETTSDPVSEFTFSQPGGYAPQLTVVDNVGAEGSISGDLIVEQPRSLACEANPTEVEPGETVTLDASGSEGVQFVEFDVDGDGEYDQGDETDLVVETSYNETGTYRPTARADVEDGTTPCGEIVVEEPDSGIPLWPFGVGGGGLLGLGLLYYFLGPGGAGGGGGGGGGTPKPKPKPGLGGDEDQRYETGVFEIPPSSGKLAVSVGFEPDLVFFSATNGARTDSATDRTAGWSRGIGFSGPEAVTNFSLTVADDAQTTDQATAAADDNTALQLLRHADEQPPGRVRLALAETTADGFEVDVQVPGDDPFASGIRVHYQAIRTASDVDVGVGTFMTPTEPGTQVVNLGIPADHVSLLGSAAVTDTGRLWTTDRGVALSGGHAVNEQGRIHDATWGASAWPRAGHDSAAVAGTGVLNLLYQDGKDLAGRTRARVSDIGTDLRLRYDRVYNGPHKLGSTARHVVAYLAMNGGQAMRPAVGAVPLPGPDEQLQVDCGFEPAMVEVTISGAPMDEEVPNWSAPQPFGWSEGTAISDDERLRQYVLHHAYTPAPKAGAPSAGAGTAADETTAEGGASPDGGRPQGTDSQPAPGVGTDPGPAATGAPEMPEGSGEVPADPTAQSPGRDQTGSEPYRLQPPTAVPDDGIVGLSLLQDDEGTVIGRDECRIQQLTPYGFTMTVDRTETDGTASPESRPTVIYRAWPAVDGREAEQNRAEQQQRPQTGPAQQESTGPGVDQRVNTDPQPPQGEGTRMDADQREATQTAMTEDNFSSDPAQDAQITEQTAPGALDEGTVDTVEDTDGN